LKRVRPFLVFFFAAFLFLHREDAFADGGAVRLKQTSGSFAITVFSPESLRVGSVDLSVLVQGLDGAALLDAEVELGLEDPAHGAVVWTPATREQATNKLLRAALVELPQPGKWKLVVRVHRGADVAEVTGEIDVASPPPRLATLWPYLALPAVVVALFAAAQWLSLRRRTSAPARD